MRPSEKSAEDVRGGRVAAWFSAGLVLLLVVLNLDLLTGRVTPCYRDLATTQRPARLLFTTLGPAATNPYSSFGQPYAGNPNLVLGYPFPRAPRFLGLHLLLHLLIGLLGSYAFLSRLVRSREAALFGALSFGFSGYVLSSTAFLNATTTLAWLPWLLVATHAVRDVEGRRVLLPGTAILAFTGLLLLGGEPVLAAAAFTVALGLAVTAPPGTRRRSVLVLGTSLGLALVALAPWLLEVLRASEASSRRLRGFSWMEFAAVGFHPARLLETPFPLLFGDTTRVLAGGFWGFAATQGNPPYHAQLTFGVLPATFALLLVFSARRYEARLFTALGALALLFSFTPWIPGARALYEVLPLVRVLRYPGKAILLVSLAIAVMAAIAVDSLVAREALPRYRRRASWVLLGVAGAFAALAVVLRLKPDVARALLMRGWDSAWAADPRVVLAPIVERIPLQAAAAAAALLLVVVLLKRPFGPREKVLLLAATALELLVPARRLIPAIDPAFYDHPSPLTKAAAGLPGRVYERTAKDLDVVRRGLFGRLTADDVAAVSMVQTRQAWALVGTPHGLRYAYDKDPDGSYTYLNRVATDVVESRDWSRRLKWLRSAAVGTVIASDVPEGLPGLAKVLSETEIGIPTTLYRLEGSLPGVRRASRAFTERTSHEAVARFERADFSPETDVVVWGRELMGQPPAILPDLTSPASAGEARLVTETADYLLVETSGDAPGILHVDRSYAPRVAATVNGARAVPFAVNLHLIGIAVPKGPARVEIELTP